MDDLTTFLDAWTAAERTGDAAATDRLLTDDFVGVGPLGFELDKSAWLARQTGGGLRYEHLALDQMTSRVHGGCAVVTARWNARGTAGGHPVPEAARTTLVAVDGGDGWRLAGIHYSFIAGTPGAPPVPGAP